MNFSVLLDGQRMGSWVLPHSASAMIDGVRTSDSTIRPFEFAMLQVIGMHALSLEVLPMSHCQRL